VRCNLTTKEFPGSTDEGTLQPSNALVTSSSHEVPWSTISSATSSVGNWMQKAQLLMVACSTGRPLSMDSTSKNTILRLLELAGSLVGSSQDCRVGVFHQLSAALQVLWDYRILMFSFQPDEVTTCIPGHC
jgi:hypothetical protein